MRKQSGIYISYRRADASAAARRLFDRLRRQLPGCEILVDAQFEPGASFNQALAETLSRMAVMLVVIGPHWLTDTDQQGRRRIDDPADWVRGEVALALQRGIRVVPVLVDGALMPHDGELPTDLQPLVRRHGFELSHDRWGADVDHLAGQLAGIVQDGVAPSSPLERLRNFIRPSVAAGAADQATAPVTSRQPPSPVASPSGGKPAPAPAPAQAAAAPARGAADVRDVFISYAFEDEAWAQRVVDAVEALGWRCWIASRDIPPGTASYARAITRAIRTSRLFVVLLSEACNASDDVLNEITLAKDAKVPRLPVRIDDAPIGDGLLYFFSQAQRLEGGGQGADAVLARVTAAVRRHLAAEPTAD